MMMMRSCLKSSFAVHPTCCSLHANMEFTRPRCGCRCECSHRPYRRIPCTNCYHLIGPGCCATDHELGALTGICHRCSEANPQEVDGASRATTELADEECGFWQIKWRRITIDILRRWERGKACIWTNMRHHSKWTRILAERQAAKCSQEAE